MNQRSLGLGRPTGWYFVERSDKLAPEQLKTRRFFGDDLILFRTESGRLVATEPYCPHLGAHLGHGGKVEGELLRCPFHGFCFDTEGECVSTPYGFKAPPKATVATVPIIERHGLILAWYDELGREPYFDIPELDVSRWSVLKTITWDLRSHPQETTENSVDVGHFTAVHGYDSVRSIKPLELDGPYLTAKYGMKRDATIVGRPGHMLDAEFTVHVHGLGYSQVDVDVVDLGLETRQFVLPTPTDDDRIDLTIGIMIHEIEQPGKLNPLARLVPERLLRRLVVEGAFWGYKHDVSQDFDMWQNKIYLERPRLAKGDGPIGPYRKWCKQFYPEHGADVATLAAE